MPPSIKKPTKEEVFSGEIARVGSWVVACVDPQFPWPTSIQKVQFRGQTLYLLPQFDDYFPSVCLHLGNGIQDFEDGQVLVLNFLSSLAWVNEKGVLVDEWTGGSRANPIAGFSRSGIFLTVTDHFRLHYLPEIEKQEVRWALAFFREGHSIRPTPYAFLSYYRVINLVHRFGADQKAWINKNVDAAVHRTFAKKRLLELRANVGDVGTYLYESCRCAVAHAGQGTTVDPENPADLKRLAEDLPVIKALAAFAIEHEFGVKSSMTIFREHLYELEGFRVLLGEKICDGICDDIVPAELPAFPPLQITLFGEDYPPLKNLLVEQAEVEGGTLHLMCTSENGRTRMVLGLDFANERLRIDSLEGLFSLDDGSEAAMRDAVSVMEFKKAYFLNGELIVNRADTGERLGRCDAFLPTNVDMGATVRNFDGILKQLRSIAEERAKG